MTFSLEQLIASFEQLIARFDPSFSTFAALGVGIGSMLLVFGISGVLAGREPALQRMAKQGSRHLNRTVDRGILRPSSADPTGLLKTLIPSNRAERTEVQRQLAQAGLSGPHAVRNYYLVRLFLGILLPCALVTVTWATRTGLIILPESVGDTISAWSPSRLIQVASLLVGLGFFGPAIWLRSRTAERIKAIEESFPNALDLIQISVEAGLGFDAAMIRVANEIESTAPAISQEMLIAQHEIQAGRGRDKALLDMAARTGVAEVVSFANVVLQSMQFGTSTSETLSNYATEMRKNRELRAQEMANKLPVKMSAIMASLMLPALLMLTLGPVVIRYIRYLHG